MVIFNKKIFDKKDSLRQSFGRRFVFFACLCLCFVSLVSCKFGWNELFYRKDDVDRRASVMAEIPSSDFVLPSSDVYTVVLFSDIHFGKSGKAQRYEDVFLSWLQAKVDAASAPDFCICLGDIADHGYESEYKQYNDFASKIEQILLTPEGKHKVFNVLGNHDLYNSGYEYYSKMIYPYKSFYHFQTKNFSWYVIDSASDTLGNLQFDVLKNAMENDTHPKLVFGHVPVYGDPGFKFSYFSFQNEYESSNLLSLFAKNGVRASFSGHTHAYYRNDWPNLTEFIVPSITVSETKKKDGQAKTEWALLTVNETEGTISIERITVE